MFLVTGGAGFIGSNLVASLSENGWGPIAVCDFFGGDAKWRNLAKHPIHETVAPSDLPIWLAANSGQVDAVLHMGAISATTETDVDLILQTNLTLSQDLWRFCADEAVPFIYASSAATYGDGAQGFTDDNDAPALGALRPLNPYGWSKKLFDDFAVAQSATGHAPPFWAGLKFFNVYGPNEYHKGSQRSVAHQLFEQIRDRGNVTLFKSHHPDYVDGGQLRDFVHVEDCTRMMSWLLEHKPKSGIYNCGSGKARSFKDLALATFAAMEMDPKIDFVDTPEAIRRHYQYFTEADMSRIRAQGYDRNALSLEDGVANYVQSFLATDDPYR